MASPVSLREVLILVQTVYDLYKKYTDAPQEMKHIMLKMKSVELCIKDIADPKNQTSWLKSPDGKEFVKLRQEVLSSLKSLLEELREIGLKWKRDRKNPLKKFFFVVWTKSDVPSLGVQLESSWEDLSKLQKQIHYHGQQDNFKDLKKDNQDLKDELQKLENQIKRHNKKTQAVVTSSRNQRDVTITKARRAAQEATDRTNQDPNIHNQQFENVLKQVFTEYNVPDGSVQKLLQSVKPADMQAQVLSYRDSTTMMEILVVCDLADASMAVMTQAYLELIRVWTANVHGRWLFKRVTSAIHTSSPGPKPRDLNRVMHLDQYKPIYESAMRELSENMKYLKTHNWPHEENSVISRMAKHRLQDLRDMNLKRYNYILCLNKEKHKKMKGLVLQGIFEPGTIIDHLDHGSPAIDRRTMKTFLDEQLTWTKPSKDLSDGQYRTCWVTCKYEKQRDALIKENRAPLEEKTGCKVRVSWQGADRGWIAAITGRPWRLRQAQQAVEHAIQLPLK